MNVTDVYETSINKWSRNKGIGTISYDRALDLFTPIKAVLNKFFSFDPNRRVTVVVPSAVDIDHWSTALIKDFQYADKIGTDMLKFITADSIIFNKYKDDVTLLIFYRIEKFIEGERLKLVKGEYITYKYLLGVTNSPDPYDDTFGLYAACPVIDRVTKVDVVTHGLLDASIDFNVGLTMNNNDQLKFRDYSSFIKDTIDMFNGDFNLILNCYHGDRVNGISADMFRNDLATSKGWSKDIDTSSTYFSNIDRYFSPNALYERAKSFTEIIKKRKNLLSDNDVKVAAVLEIIEKYKDKKILIINKRPNFANVLSYAINDRIKGHHLKVDKPKQTLFNVANDKKLDAFTVKGSFICVEYHPNVESRPLIDIETNDFIKYKSGNNKGKVKKFGATSLNKIANERFNEGYHTVMSTSNSMPKTAELTIDFVIVTSPECDTLNKFQYRVNRLDFSDNVKIVNLYLHNTKELDKLKEKQALTKTKVINSEIKDLKL